MLRGATFASSIVLLVIVPGRGRTFPLAPIVVFLLGVVSLGLLHPALNTSVSGIATVAFYLAIWAPIFWVTRITITPLVLANMLLLLWAFNTLSAGLGVLQVYNPDRFAPNPEFVKKSLGVYADGLLVQLNDGRQVYRPFGLTDSPGGAAASGSFAALVGLLLVGARGWGPRILGGGSVAISMFCIYLSYIRSLLVVTLISIFGLVVALVVRGQGGRASGIVGVATVAMIGAFVWAVAVGAGVEERFATLLEDNPAKVYHSNRGIFLEETLVGDIPRYPMGAGLGRYGMMYSYFGTSTNPDSPPLWAEIQPTAWVFDGGILLLLSGYGALIGTVVLATRFAIRVRDDSVAALAAVVAGFDLSILINTTSYCNFLSQGGMMFWVINAALYVACTEPDTR
ncbi:MAG: hypothetical protein K8U57_23010 [Planctomycetes bacterium]|nr:hypothetical protein [Planctomycetota bacterium]